VLIDQAPQPATRPQRDRDGHESQNDQLPRVVGGERLLQGIMYTAVPSIGPSIVPSPPVMVANAISAVHCTLNTAPGFT